MRSLYFLICQLCAFASFDVALGANISPPNLRTEEKPKTLQMIFSVFRHGDRAPVFSWPKDPYKNYSWPGGMGALSEKGVSQLYNLGQNLRHRYSHLLPPDGRYSAHNMFARSSHVERCIMSGQSLLAGFMPPHKNLNQLPIAWQPVPITTIPKLQDMLLAQYRPCKKYEQVLEGLYNDLPADIKKLNEENKDIYKTLQQETGWPNITLHEIFGVYNTLGIHKDNGFVLPEWSEDIYPERIRPFAERYFSMWTETSYMKKVKGGPFITEVYNNMVAKQENTLNPDRKIFFFAAHEYTNIQILNALGILDQAARLPQYASMTVFELHTSETLKNDFEVKIVYYEDSNVIHPKELYLSNCPSPCSLAKFGATVKDLLVDDFDKLCEN